MPHRPLAEKRQNALSALDLLAGDPAEQDTIRQACRDCASQLRAQTDELLAYQRMLEEQRNSGALQGKAA